MLNCSNLAILANDQADKLVGHVECFGNGSMMVLLLLLLLLRMMLLGVGRLLGLGRLLLLLRRWRRVESIHNH